MPVPPLPPHFTLSLEHNSHRLAGLTALDAVAGIIDPRSWTSPEEIVRALETDSVWHARLVAPTADVLTLRYASDLDVLLEALRAA